ncbi:MAG: cell division protein FtsX [Maricaulaceae bacterium]
MSRPAPGDLPKRTPALLAPLRDRDAPLLFVMAVMIFLACVAALAALGAARSAQAWSADLARGATVQIKAGDPQEAEALAARAAEALGQAPGVVSARVGDRSEAVALLEPWLGRGNVPDDLPVPLFVALTFNPDARPSTASLQRPLEAAGIAATVDDHGRWAQDVARASNAVQSLGAGAFLMLAAAAFAVVGFATRAGLASQKDLVDTLHLAGARDGFIAGVFQGRFLSLGIKAGLAGTGLALLAGLALSLAGGDAGASFLGAPRPEAADLAWLALAPPFAGIAAAITARLTVLGALRAGSERRG